MKRFLIATLGVLAFSQASFAAMSFADLQQVTQLAYTDFSTAHPDHVVHFTGFKTWISGETSRVKVYVNHEGMAMEYSYLCERHETALECHHQ